MIRAALFRNFTQNAQVNLFLERASIAPLIFFIFMAACSNANHLLFQSVQ